MCKYDSICPYLQNSTLFKCLSHVFRDKDYPKMNDTQFQRKNVFDLISFRKC